MEKLLMEVSNLSKKIGENTILNNISFSIKEDSINAFLFPNNGGKTTLIKALSGILYADNGTISVNNVILSTKNYKKYITLISTILEDIDNQFICDKVSDEITLPLRNLGYSNKKIKKLISEVLSIIDISSILEKEITSLSRVDKIKVLIATSIVHHPKLLLIDDILRFLTIKEKKQVLKVINDIDKKLDISIIFTTSDLNDVIGLKNIYVLNEGSILMSGTYKEIIMRDNELTKIGIEIPLMIDLSRKLQFYNLIDGIYYDPDKVVDKLWK